MNPPTTPTKKGEGINRLVRSLNTSWRLRLPDRTAPISPSKVVNPDSRGEKIYRLICFLYFQRHEALMWACERFESHAQQQSTQWVYKPGAETDTLPSRQPSDSLLRPGPYIRVNGVYEPDVNALEETLLRFLNEAKDFQPSPIRRDSIPRSGTETRPVQAPQSEEQPALGHSLSGCSLASFRNVLNANLASPGSSAQSSTYISNPDQDTADIMRDLVMADAENSIPFKRQSSNPSNLPIPFQLDPVDCEEVFSTPPSTPPGRLVHDADPRIDRAEPFTGGQINEQYSLQETDSVQLPKTKTSGGKKRPLPSAPTFAIPRKMTRETQGRHAPETYGVNHLELSVSGSFSDMSRSFESASQMTANTVTAASTTLTTPNTSFYTESAATSFGDSLNDDASVQLMREQEAYNRKELAETNLKPREDIMELDEETPRKAAKYSVRKRLEAESPFAQLIASNFSHLPFRQLYEMSRMALHCKSPLSALSSDLERVIDDQDQLWLLLKPLNEQGKPMPERSRNEAWEKAETESQAVVFSGDLSFSEKFGGPIFDFRLKPMRKDKSNRLSRKFGGDRFLILNIPGFTAKELPPVLRADPTGVRDSLISWLLETDHRFLGRIWRAFLVKQQQMSTDVRKKNMGSFNAVKHRVFLFAVDGDCFRRRSGRSIHKAALRKCYYAITVHELLEWFMPIELNSDQSCLKLFARLNLAVSDTTSTVTFKPTEIIRTNDAFADSPAVRRLCSDHRTAHERNYEPLPKRIVMNDGCARISRPAAAAIANMLGVYGPAPSAFQGRIGGAKGMWMVDPLSETCNGSDRDYWIEITDSQLKFECHPIDVYDPDPARVTFEVQSIPRSLSATTLNYQLIPILIDRGVPSEVFEKLLEDDLTAKVSELEIAMDTGLALRKWTQENSSVAAERRNHGSVDWMGGMPNSLTEKINWFVEHGFEPRSCALLRDFCFKAVHSYCERLENRMNIGLGRSTYAFMIADPLAILEEGEIHLGFSAAFTDKVSEFSDTMLNDMDILVARLPAHLPSDIQKVRAVFKPELAIYKDVIIFSSKGDCSLAEKLSGGDYDGDRAWICWEPSLVTPFVNAPTHSAPPDDFYCLQKDSTKVSEIISKSDYISAFLRKGFEFAIQPHMLGICTAYHEALCYKGRSIASPMAKNIAILLGRLVDSAKGGLLFTEEVWNEFKRKNHLQYHLPKPAYKDKLHSEPTNHIIDRLVFTVANGVSKRALGAFTKRFEDASYWDDDLNAVWKAEDERSKSDATVKEVLDDLRTHIDSLHHFWSTNCTRAQADEFRPSRSNPSEASLNARIEQTRERFLAIQPLASNCSAIVDRWRKDDGSTKGAWARLKASVLFQRYCKYGKFPWYACGKELGELKMLGREGGRCVAEELWVHYKLDPRSVKKLEAAEAAKETGSEGFEGDVDVDEDEEKFGEWDDEWAEGILAEE